jgi:hypothetical protein
MNEKIDPRIDENGVGWCDVGCPHCTDVSDSLGAHICDLWPRLLFPDDSVQCPIHAQRLFAKADELQAKVKELEEQIGSIPEGDDRFDWTAEGFDE